HDIPSRNHEETFLEDHHHKTTEIWRACLTSWLGLDSYRDGPLDYAYLDRGSGEAIGNTKSSRWGPYTIS
ncbi:hypothetical protein ARMSODRAFT_1010174, partial [Armillaria solidipes]